MSENGQYVPGSLWFYAPNKGAPVFFAVAFCASTVWQLWQTYHNKCWRMTGVLVFAGTLFTAGFITREIAAFDYGNLVKLIVSVCLVYAAPPLFELANYQILGRILYYVPHLSPIHPGRVLTTFAFISSVVEALNGNGASYSTNQSLPKSKQDIGKALLKAALLIQIVVVVLFLALTVTFHRRVHAAKIRSPKLTGVLRTLYASSALIAVRTIYRIVEYFSLAELHFGPGLNPDAFGPEVRYEWFFYVFEATLMLCNASLWNVRHPRKYLPKSTKVYLARDGVTEVVGPGYKDTRSFWVTLVDPFDLKGMLGKKNGRGTTEFWNEVQGGTNIDSERTCQ
ncbi:hypothetical protein M406DRAFT_346983 [Cryphonectria parasitica EP155]|uniref:RTA1 domain protein n=1 Tax=Cryphonectria parasitica (strain ATCC 38755 / EP155) TaxID=660469 RepID=A0A9P4XY66_CRYP1|nr:uncharacterized protein M406DRAFT_346983 [Cryphonectria parasitica EP155]KAF3763061.1 hypothetical protein M406DRAFT_346983 [Cryphonectria parasitica EP155]